MKKKIVKLTESELEELIKNITEDISNQEDVDEGLLDSIKQPFQKMYYGVKGLRGGFGYDYMAYLVELRNMLKELKKLDEPNEKIFLKLNKLKVKVQSTSMRPELQRQIVTAINKAMNNFRSYANIIDALTVAVNKKLKPNTPQPTQQQPPPPTPTPTPTPTRRRRP